MRKVAQLLTTILVVSFCSTLAQSATIVGIGNYGDMFSPGTLYSVNPMTGAVTPLGQFLSDGAYPISPGPVPGSFFVLSPVNHYLVNYLQGTSALWECYLCGAQLPSKYTGDYAYDSSNGKFFSTMVYGASSSGYFVQMSPDGPIPGYPGSVYMVPSIIAASSDFNNSLIMEYIQGLGLYATDGRKAFLIDENTGAETLLPSLFYMGPTITGLAYDPDSGQLIGTGGRYNALPGATGYIYSINPLTGQVTVLNSNAPNMIGLAEFSTPEPSTMVLLAAGFLCFWLWLKPVPGPATPRISS